VRSGGAAAEDDDGNILDALLRQARDVFFQFFLHAMPQLGRSVGISVLPRYPVVRPFVIVFEFPL
jgi:hypothetical protein